jgi:hypothetical protein
MTESSTRRSRFVFPWGAFMVAVLVIAITQIPFELGKLWAPERTTFDGSTGMTQDQNMYFSFIRQAAEGRWLFTNRLTHVDHDPAMFNLEWLAVGRLMAFCGNDLELAYTAWRWVGSAGLVLAFWGLASVAGLSRFQRRLAVVLCAFGGGFGWIVVALERRGLIPTNPLATLDVSDALLYPFSHIFFNPHLSTSHGLSLFFLATYALGETTHKARWYLIASCIAVVHGLIRPYDLILTYGVLPLFIVVEAIVAREWSWRRSAWRALPLLATAPVIAYYIALFEFHPVFKYWASQGVVRPLALQWQLFSLGPIGVLFFVRLCLLKRFPLKLPAERLLIVWIATMLILFHAHRFPGMGFMPYTPLLGITMTSTMLLLGVGLIDAPYFLREGRPAWGRRALLEIAVLGCTLSSAVWMVKICRNLHNLPEHFIESDDRRAYDRLNEFARDPDITLGSLVTGNRAAKYASSRFVLGHINITPNVHELSARVKRFYSGDMSDEEAVTFLDEMGVDWIYFGLDEMGETDVDLAAIPGVKQQFDFGGVQLYRYEREAGRRSGE